MLRRLGQTGFIRAHDANPLSFSLDLQPLRKTAVPPCHSRRNSSGISTPAKQKLDAMISDKRVLGLMCGQSTGYTP
jgi:hypothetical protein